MALPTLPVYDYERCQTAALALMHVVLEAQSRYHYPLAHVVLLLAGAGLISAGPRVAGFPEPHA